MNSNQFEKIKTTRHNCQTGIYRSHDRCNTFGRAHEMCVCVYVCVNARCKKINAISVELNDHFFVVVIFFHFILCLRFARAHNYIDSIETEHLKFVCDQTMNSKLKNFFPRFEFCFSFSFFLHSDDRDAVIAYAEMKLNKRSETNQHEPKIKQNRKKLYIFFFVFFCAVVT